MLFDFFFDLLDVHMHMYILCLFLVNGDGNKSYGRRVHLCAYECSGIEKERRNCTGLRRMTVCI